MTRARILEGMRSSSTEWENPFLETLPDAIIVAGFRKDALRDLTGKTLAEAASLRGTTPEETLVDLLVEDDNNVGALYFAMSEDDVRKVLSLPWVSLCSDEESQAPEGIFLKANPHPRAYGAFARVLGTYVRDEGILPLEEAIRRMTSLPAENQRPDSRRSDVRDRSANLHPRPVRRVVRERVGRAEAVVFSVVDAGCLDVAGQRGAEAGKAGPDGLERDLVRPPYGDQRWVLQTRADSSRPASPAPAEPSPQVDRLPRRATGGCARAGRCARSCAAARAPTHRASAPWPLGTTPRSIRIITPAGFELPEDSVEGRRRPTPAAIVSAARPSSTTGSGWTSARFSIHGSRGRTQGEPVGATPMGQQPDAPVRRGLAGTHDDVVARRPLPPRELVDRITCTPSANLEVRRCLRGDAGEKYAASTRRRQQYATEPKPGRTA